MTEHEPEGLRAAVEAVVERMAVSAEKGREDVDRTNDIWAWVLDEYAADLTRALAASEADREPAGRIVCTNCDADDLGCTACGAHGTLTVTLPADDETGLRDRIKEADDERGMNDILFRHRVRRIIASEADRATTYRGPGDFWTQAEWCEWSNRLAELLPEEYDGDAAQESLIEKALIDLVSKRAEARAWDHGWRAGYSYRSPHAEGAGHPLPHNPYEEKQ